MFLAPVAVSEVNMNVVSVHWALLYLSVFSCCILTMLVAADLQKSQNPTNKSLDPYVNQEPVENEEKLLNSSHIPEIAKEKVSTVTEEIRGSFDDVSDSSVKPNMKTAEDILQPTGFKYTSISDGLSESGEGVMVTLMEQRLISPEPPIHNESGPPLPVQDKGGGKEPPANETDQPHDDIPSFSEWAKKQLAEAEKNKGENLTVGSSGGSGMKLRSKNYASPDCGAKVLAANPEAVSPGAVLSSSRDEYILSPCNAKTWFIVELCEAIQPQRIEVANFELFSSSPKDFSIHLSDRYPTREWTLAITITAKDERTVQSFPLPHLPQFAKFVKIEIHSHYGTEHYCPVSLFRAYGTSELEVLETVDEVASGAAEEEDENEGSLDNSDEAIPQNLFGSARDAVLSIVKKAAEVLVVKSQSNSTCKEANTTSSQSSHCVTPGYNIVCHNCNDNFFYRVYHLLCCHQASFQSLLASPFVSKVLSETNICSDIGLEWPRRGPPILQRPSTSLNYYSPSSAYIQALLPKETITALCNMLAVSHRKVVLNVSQDASSFIESSMTENVNTSSVIASVPTTQPTVPSAIPVSAPPIVSITSQADSFSTSLPHSRTNLDPSFMINPTKTLSKEDDLHVSVEPDANLTVDSADQNETIQGVEEPMSGETAEVTPKFVGKEIGDEERLGNKTVNETQNIIEPTVEDPTAVDSLDSLLSEFEEETEVPVTAKANAVPPHHVQKESVFVRLANRIKALERNMSLSSQYLEELSRRYKKQVEELQRTLANVLEDRRLSAERETMQVAQLTKLTQRVDILTNTVSELIMERESWTNKASLIGQHGLIILVEILVFVVVMSICRWLGGGTQSADESRSKVVPTTPARRRSLDDIDTKPKQRKRRPSEEAMHVAGSAHNELLIDGIGQKVAKCEVKRRKRRRKERAEVPALLTDMVVEPIRINGGTENGRLDNDIGAGGGSWPVGEAVVNRDTLPPPPPDPVVVKSTLWSRRNRVSTSQTQTSGSSQETISAPITTPSKPHKKPGPLKKIVKKLF